MSDGQNNGTPNPFQGIFSDLARMLANSGDSPINWDLAEQIATMVAGEGESSANADPIERSKLEELMHVAELQVGQVVPMSIGATSLTTLNHVAWATRSINDFKPVFETLAKALNDSANSSPDNEGVKGEGYNDEQLSNNPLLHSASGMQDFSQMQKWMRPMMLGMQVGGMIGHLSKWSLAAFDLPLPRPQPAHTTHTEIVLIPDNINRFAADWNLDVEELRLYTCIEEITRSAILHLPHVAQRLTELSTAYLSRFRLDTDTTAFDMFGSNPTQMFGSDMPDITQVMGVIVVPENDPDFARLNAILAAIYGYVDYAVKVGASRTIGSASVISEANMRRRVEETEAHQLVKTLLGIHVTQAQYDRGTAFVHGVLERAGQDGLDRLWKSRHELPTPADVDAPGLWLERIDLPPLDD